MITENKSFKLLSCLLFAFILITTTICLEYRPIDGKGNNRNQPSAGIPNIPFARNTPSTSYFADVNNSMINTPGEYTSTPTTPPTILSFSCASALPKNVFPLPRCVSNKLMSTQSKDDDIFNLSHLEKFKSKRKVSHMLTYWGLFMKMDVSSGFDRGLSFPNGIYIPADDQEYLSSYRNGPKPANFTYLTGTLPFNRSVPDGGNTGINEATSFLDASIVYGNNDASLRIIRDYGNNGKMLLIKDSSTADGAFGYPPTDTNGFFIYGYSAEFGRNVFTDFFHILFLREHNRLCDEFFAIHGNNWDDETYFQEARRWIIAFIQKITYYEYLGTALGTPLPKYDGYKPEITPSIDTFFSTVTYRYGHSEISNFHDILNDHGELLTRLGLNDLENSRLIKIYGMQSIALSLALQRQEEVDIYVADFARYYLHKSQYFDIVSLDTVRSRDHGIPLYNDAREAFGLSRKQTFADISNDTEVQQRLKDTYTTVDRIESLMGGLAEDHVNGGNYGELFYKSFSEQWIKIRATDRFWYENTDAGFSKDDIAKIQTTTLLDIIKRNTQESSIYPQNIWFVQPPTFSKLTSDSANGGYNSPLLLSDDYSIQWKFDSTNITFLITMGSTNAWFGLGFNPNGNSMTDTDMMIFENTNDKDNSNELTVTGKNYKGIGIGIVPMLLDDDNQILTILNQKVENGVTSLEVTRPINGKNGKSLDGDIDMVYAWNPNSNKLTYHGGNRGRRTINFRTGSTSDLTDNRPKLLRMHGIAMFIIWGVLFPISIWIVRYLRHADGYMVQHRNLSLFGGMIVGIFAAVALTATTVHGTSAHAVVGITIITIIVIQISLGILAIWSLANVESASTGIIRNLKHFHFYLGGTLLLAAWTNLFLGMITYDKKFGGDRGENRVFIWAYTAWLIFFGFVITASEFYYKIKNMQFLWPVKDSEDSTKRIHKCIPDNVYENLPVMTWKEFNHRIMTGANLVVAEGLVFDIHKWIPLHPGGQKILQRVIGTDITNDFFFDPQVKAAIQNKNNVDNYDVEEPRIPLLTDNTYKEMTNPNRNKPHSVANAFDMINAIAFKHRRVAMHRHSKFATSKLASMVIATILDSDDNSIQQQQQQHQQTRNISEVVFLQPPPSNSRSIFRRYILTNIEVVTRSNSENPVKKLTFQVTHPNDSLPKFLPGDYIEIMSYANNHVVTRPYTPLQGPNENSFYILTKIYKDGVMTQHLNKQLKNFEVKVRGPFDISDRMTSPFSPALEPNSTTMNSHTRTLSGINRGVYNSTPQYLQNDNNQGDFGDRSGILLNKERDDLCWDCLFMVCGGTGITPMIQLIQYHMEKAATSNSDFKLYLLAAYEKVDDVIYPRYLDYLSQSLQGKLEIKYILSRPPTIWRDYSGPIDDALLYDWISERYLVPPPAIPPKISNYGSGSNFTSNLSSGIQNMNAQNYPNPNNIQNYPYPNNTQNYPNINQNYPNLNNTHNNYLYSANNHSTQEVSNQQYVPTMGTPPIPIPVSNKISVDQTSSSSSSSSSPHLNNNSPHTTSQIMLMNERLTYMNSFAMDNSKQVKLIVCGSEKFNRSIRISLDKIPYPIDTKAIFIS